MTSAAALLVGQTTAAEDRHLLSLAAEDRSRLIVPVSPLVDSHVRLAGAVLTALGKRPDHAPMGRQERDEVGLMQDWLTANQTRSVLFHGADRLPAEVLAGAAATVVAARGAPVFTFRTRDSARRAVRALRVRPRRTDVEGIEQRLTAMECDRLPAPDPIPLPSLRFDDPYARPPKSEWAHAVRQVRSVFAAAHLGPGADPYAQARRLLAAEGWELVVTDEALLRQRQPSLGFVPPDFTWAQLHAFRSTDLVAAAVLAALGLSTLELVYITGDHVRADGSAVAVRDDVLPVPTGLRVFLRARRATLEREERLHHPLLARSSKRLYKGEVRTMVAAAFGAPTVRLDLPLRVDPLERWLRRHGLAMFSTVPRGAAAVLYTRAGRADRTHTYRTFHSVWPGALRGRRRDPADAAPSAVDRP